MAKTYEPIATTTLGSATSSVTFSSVSGYTDIILVFNGTPTGSAQSYLRVNGDTNTNYSDTYLYGDGSSTGSGRNATQNLMYCGYLGASGANSVMTVHLMNYANSSTYKTFLSRGSLASAEVGTHVGLWRNSAAITSITFGVTSNNLNTGSTVTIYGIKAA